MKYKTEMTALNNKRKGNKITSINLKYDINRRIKQTRAKK